MLQEPGNHLRAKVSLRQQQPVRKSHLGSGGKGLGLRFRIGVEPIP